MLTPMICILIIFGLQKLVDSIKMDTPDQESIQSLFSSRNSNKIIPLLNNFQPNLGKDIVLNFKNMVQKIQEANLEIKYQREITNEEAGKFGFNSDSSSQFRILETEKIVDDIKIPFNMVVPINMPITNDQLKEYFKDQIDLKTCYKFLRFGTTVPGNDSEDFLKNTLKIDDNENDLRKTQCVMYKDDKRQPEVTVPNVSFLDNLDSENSLNKRMLEYEFDKLKEYNLFKINEEIEPTDGFMIFEKASNDGFKGLMSANNIQFFAYHHDNLMNMVKTGQNLTMYLNTETYITMIDILSNRILSLNQKKNNQENIQKKEELASLFKNIFSKLSIKDFINLNSQNSKTEIPKQNIKSKLGSWIKSGANQIRQILSLSFTLPDRDYNKVMLTNMFQLLNIIFYPFAIGMGLPIILTTLAMEKEEKIRDLLKINGMSMFKYYLSNFVFWFIFLSIINTVFFVGGYFMLNDGFFYNNSVGEIIAFCFGWSVEQIVFAFFILTMISSAGAASAIGCLLYTSPSPRD